MTSRYDALRRPMPDDFPEVCQRMAGAAMILHYKTSQPMIRRWFKEAGIDPLSVRQYHRTKPSLRPVPPDFAETEPHMTMKELAKYYTAGHSTIIRWRKEVLGTDAGRPGGIRLRRMPADFRNIGPTLTIIACMKHYKASARIVKRWYEDAKVKPAVHQQVLTSAPLEFREVARGLSNNECVAKFGVSKSIITRWRKDVGVPAPRMTARYSKIGMPTDKSTTGGRRITFNRPGPQAAPDSGRDDRPVGLAVEYMRSGSRGWQITRCDADGTFNPRGDHYRVGTMPIKTADEIMAWARDKGWKLVDIFSIAA